MGGRTARPRAVAAVPVTSCVPVPGRCYRPLLSERLTAWRRGKPSFPGAGLAPPRPAGVLGGWVRGVPCLPARFPRAAASEGAGGVLPSFGGTLLYSAYLRGSKGGSQLFSQAGGWRAGSVWSEAGRTRRRLLVSESSVPRKDLKSQAGFARWRSSATFLTTGCVKRAVGCLSGPSTLLQNKTVLFQPSEMV